MIVFPRQLGLRVEIKSMSDSERRLWVLNWEPLYNLWRFYPGKSIYRFVKENRVEIDRVINSVLGK